MKLILSVALSLLSACVTGGTAKTDRSNFYDQAIAMANPDEPHPVILVPMNAVPQGELIPYALLYIVSHNAESAVVEYLWRECVPHRPDLVSYGTGQDIQTGTIGAYWGFGISTATPVYSRQYNAWCLRATEASFPFKVDASLMVMAIDEDQASAGLLEGDKVLSVNGATFDEQQGMNSSWFGMRLALKPGDEVSVVAIRPGAGRIAAKLRAKPNPRTFRNLPDQEPPGLHVVKSPGDATWHASYASQE